LYLLLPNTADSQGQAINERFIPRQEGDCAIYPLMIMGRPALLTEKGDPGCRLRPTYSP
jgi:hypothetical protein